MPLEGDQQPPIARLDDEQLKQLKDQLMDQLRNDRGENLLNNQTEIFNQIAQLVELTNRQSNRTHGGRPPTWGNKEDEDTTWSSFVSRFKAWCMTEGVSDDQAKSYLFQSIRGQPAAMILNLEPGSAKFVNNTADQYIAEMDSVFRPESESEISRSVYKARKQGPLESIQAYYTSKKMLFMLAFPNKDANTDGELQHDLASGIINERVAHTVMVDPGSYTTFTAQLKRATQAVAAERNLQNIGMSSDKQGLATSGAVKANLSTYQLTQGGSAPEAMDIGAVDPDADLYDEEYEALIHAINSGGTFPGNCYKCGQKGHTIARCDKPPGWRRSPQQYRGNPWRGRGGRGQARGRGRARGGPVQRDSQGRFTGIHQVDEEFVDDLAAVNLADEEVQGQEPASAGF